MSLVNMRTWDKKGEMHKLISRIKTGDLVFVDNEISFEEGYGLVVQHGWNRGSYRVFILFHIWGVVDVIPSAWTKINIM